MARQRLENGGNGISFPILDHFLVFVVLFLLTFAPQSRLGNNMQPRPSATPKYRKNCETYRDRTSYRDVSPHPRIERDCPLSLSGNHARESRQLPTDGLYEIVGAEITDMN